MIRSVAKLPLRALKRVLSLMDGERNAPSPAPPMATVQPSPSPEKPVVPTPAAPKKSAPKKTAAPSGEA